MSRINLTRMIKPALTHDEQLHRGRPVKSLTFGGKRDVGRNNQGKVTTRHKGGGAKRRYRIIEFGRETFSGTVVRLEYDPNRSAYLALLKCEDGKSRYILAPSLIEVGAMITWGDEVELRPGNRLPLARITPGTLVHNIEFQPFARSGIARSAGSYAEFLSLEGNLATLRLPSGELRRIDAQSYASIGQLSHLHHGQELIGKAGRSRHMGIRPTVRGSAMSPYAHPHGGGEGKAGIGMSSPKTPWGKKARGVRTRSKVKYSRNSIITRRK